MEEPTAKRVCDESSRRCPPEIAEAASVLIPYFEREIEREAIIRKFKAELAKVPSLRLPDDLSLDDPYDTRYELIERGFPRTAEGEQRARQELADLPNIKKTRDVVKQTQRDLHDNDCAETRANYHFAMCTLNHHKNMIDTLRYVIDRCKYGDDESSSEYALSQDDDDDEDDDDEDDEDDEYSSSMEDI